MDQAVVARMGVEGAGVTIYGHRVDGVWLYWQEWASMDLDEDDTEVWRSWSSDRVPKLSAALPDEWWRMYPVEIHPEFAAELRDEYDRHRGSSDGPFGGSIQWDELLDASRANDQPDTTPARTAVSGRTRDHEEGRSIES